MTRKLYDEDTELLDFCARVLACSYLEKKKCFEIILDQTAFFPEEGGQMPDTGSLDGQPVIDVRLKREGPVDTILHHVKKEIPVGSTVSGHIDWKHRFDQMQQHSGEHIVSGLICSTYKANNVGFHIGKEEVTLDFDVNLSLEELKKIEEEANEAVKKNFPVLVTFPTKEEEKSLSYRSKIEIPGQLRLVEFPGYDICACCAPHVKRTGQIGLIMILSVMPHRGGCRVNILCGDRARRDYQARFDSVKEISVLLSAKQNAVACAVKRLYEENRSHKDEIIALQKVILLEKIKGLPSPDEKAHPLLIFETLDPIAARNALNELTARYCGICSILVGNDEKGYRFLTGSAKNDTRKLMPLLKAALKAKGGGSAEMIQGTIPAKAADILNVIDQAIMEAFEN